MRADLIICDASELLTMADSGLGLIKDGWLAASNGIIVALGKKENVLSKLSEDSLQQATRVDARGKTVLPGFVDCHTHLVFGGDRLEEDGHRIAGESVATMKARGLTCLGMSCSMSRTRQCSAEELYRQAEVRLQSMIANGATTVECKSGYGLRTETEILQLETTKKLAAAYEVDLISTFLGAHGWPDDMTKDDYLDLVVHEMIPLVAEKKLATFCDIWVDEGFFTAKDAHRVLSCGLDFGLQPKIHAEAYSYVGASDVAVDLRAASSDHLNFTPPDLMRKLAKAGVTGVLAPCTDYVVRHPLPANPKMMFDCGLDVAVATNCNPGCYCTSMPFALQIAARLNGMSITEALRGGTVNGAKALLLSDRGKLAPNCLADFQIWNVCRHEEFFYHLGGNLVESVYKKGRKIFSA